jgi:hypothetical protein
MRFLLKNSTKACCMKPQFILAFLCIMLLGGMLLRAASNNKKQLVIEKKTEEITVVELKKEMQLLPNALFL